MRAATCRGFGRPDSTASAGLEAHSADAGIRAGESVIADPADGRIPYQPWAAAKRDENFKNRASRRSRQQVLSAGSAADHLHAVPIPDIPDAGVCGDHLRIRACFAHDPHEKSEASGRHLVSGWAIRAATGKATRSWWTSPTTKLATWLDASGDFHSEALHVVERYTRNSPDTLRYEATIEDPKVYTRPWKISMTLYRHTEKNAQLYEYECHVYKEDGAGLLK